ncbi:MAG: hypothetical protein WA951_13765 [Leeuwenhoekiella sp.]
MEALLKQLQSVRFRDKGYTGRKLLLTGSEHSFLSFLKRALGENVFLVSTKLGLDIYYFSIENRTEFIAKNLWLFRGEDGSAQHFNIEQRSGAAVLEFFDNAVNSLSGHPQLFLSSCKKIISRFNELGVETPLNQILYTCFDNQLNRLILEDRHPFSSKIERLRNEKEEPFLAVNNAAQRLLRDFKSRNPVN